MIAILKNKIFFIAGGIVLLGFIVFLGMGSKKETPYVFTNVQRGTLVERVFASGEVKSSEELFLSFVAGGKVKSVTVNVGDHVEEEQELARLDTTSLEAQVRQPSSALASAQANLNKAIAGPSKEEIAVAQSAVYSVQTALSNAQKSADDALVKTYSDAVDILQNVRLKSDAANQAMNNFYDLVCDYKCFKKFSVFIVSDAARLKAEDQKIISDSALNDIKTAINFITHASTQEQIDTAIADVKTSLESIRLACSYTYDALQTDADKTTVKTAWTDLNTVIAQINSQEQLIISTKNTNYASITSAQAQLATAKAELDLKTAPARDVDLAALRAQVSQAQANLDSAKYNLDNAILVAPAQGVITKANIKKGETVVAGSVGISMLTDAPFAVEADVPEADIAKISIGDPLKITLDALPVVNLSGKVFSIDPGPKIIGGVVTYRIKASIDNAEQRVRAGMTANLDIETARIDNVLFVPQRAVIEKDAKSQVRVLVGGQIKNIEVKTGIRSSEGTIEIKSGLEESQEIINYIKQK